MRYVILGVGIDVNQTPSDFPGELSKVAGSLRMATGNSVDRAVLATRVLRELDHDYARICSGQFQEVAEEWESSSNTLGRTVRIRIGDRQIDGRAESLDPDGALLVRTQHGRLECITGGDLTVEK